MINLLLPIFFSVMTAVGYTPTITTYVDPVPENVECLLGADIGGTTSSVGIFDVRDDKARLLISFQTETKNIGDFTQSMSELMQYLYDTYGITIQHACIAAPGVATKKKDFSKVHGFFDIKAPELLEKTFLKTAIIVNDIFVVGYGLDSIAPDKIIHLHGEIPAEKDADHIRAIISAGTGIGSSMITWDSEKKRYITHAGEAGMMEFAPTTQLEYSFANHIQNLYGRNATYWANLASGSGITRIYSMLKLMDKYQDSLNLDTHSPRVILDNPQDELCKATSDLFFKFFGRFTRNYVWTTLPYGGLYIVGSVAAKNSELFAQKFASSYKDPQFHQELKQIPIYLITDTKVGLYGAVNYLLSEMKEKSTPE